MARTGVPGEMLRDAPMGPPGSLAPTSMPSEPPEVATELAEQVGEMPGLDLEAIGTEKAGAREALAGVSGDLATTLLRIAGEVPKEREKGSTEKAANRAKEAAINQLGDYFAKKHPSNRDLLMKWFSMLGEDPDVTGPLYREVLQTTGTLMGPDYGLMTAQNSLPILQQIEQEEMLEDLLKEGKRRGEIAQKFGALQEGIEAMRVIGVTPHKDRELLAQLLDKVEESGRGTPFEQAQRHLMVSFLTSGMMTYGKVMSVLNDAEATGQFYEKAGPQVKKIMNQMDQHQNMINHSFASLGQKFNNPKSTGRNAVGDHIRGLYESDAYREGKLSDINILNSVLSALPQGDIVRGLLVGHVSKNVKALREAGKFSPVHISAQVRAAMWTLNDQFSRWKATRGEEGISYDQHRTLTGLLTPLYNDPGVNAHIILSRMYTSIVQAEMGLEYGLLNSPVHTDFEGATQTSIWEKAMLEVWLATRGERTDLKGEARKVHTANTLGSLAARIAADCAIYENPYLYEGAGLEGEEEVVPEGRTEE